jgi:putative acetyltransferase
MIIILSERREHEQGVRTVEEQAFGRPSEADLVDRLRARGAVTLSLVAVDDGDVVGHVLFSPVTIGEGSDALLAQGLGPVAVIPNRQNEGIGSQLIRAGLDFCCQAGMPAVVVLGDPRYYSRFGFGPAKRYGIRFMDENVPEEDFMVVELRRGVLDDHSGIAKYEFEFHDV